MASYFTDEFQVSDGKKYPMSNPGGSAEPAPALPVNTKNLWQFFNAAPIVGPLGWNATGSTSAATGDKFIRGSFWPVSQSNGSIKVKLGGSLSIGDEFGMWVSVASNSAPITAYQVGFRVTEAGKAVLLINAFINGVATSLVGEGVVPFAIGDVWSFINNEGFLRVYRNGKAEQGISDYRLGVGFVAVSILSSTLTLTEVGVGSYDDVFIGRAQVVQFKEEINYTNFGILPNSYQLPPSFISNFTITPPVGTILALEELRAEVVPVFYGASLNGAVTQAEVQAFGNAINYLLGPVNAVVMRDPFQYRFQGSTTPYEWRNGMYVPAFRGAGIIERLEIIPSRRVSLQFSSHEATIKFGLVEDPIESQAVNKIFNPAINIQGGKTLGFGIETVPGRLENVSAPPIFVRYVHFLEVRMAARYRIIELGERSS